MIKGIEINVLTKELREERGVAFDVAAEKKSGELRKILPERR